MSQTYARDLDLNLLRVFVVVAESGSVTKAADRLYLTQPAISAALKRLQQAVGAPLFAREGRGVALTARGQQMLERARPLLSSLVDAALAPEAFDPKESDRTVRLGLSDAADAWLLPSLVSTLADEAPRMRVVVLPVQFRTVGQALVSGAVDLAVTVADDLPAGIGRRTLFVGGFVCLYDPRHADVGRVLTRARYFAHDHVVVSYNGDLRGVIEDALGVERKVRVSVPSFHPIGSVVEGSALLATIPESVAREIVAQRPRLRTIALPFPLTRTPLELLFRSALADDRALGFVAETIVALSAAARARGGRAAPRARARRSS